MPSTSDLPSWKKSDGSPVSCIEKIKILNQNFAELRQTAQDALDDAILMGCSEAQIRAVLHGLVDDLEKRYSEG